MSITASVVPSSHAVRVGDAPDPQVAERASRRSYTANYKAKVLAEYEEADRDGKGALLRREGLYTSLISEWRKQAAKGAFDALGKKQGRPPADPVERDNARLRAQVAKLEHELETSRRVIEVQGKLSALLEQLATGSVRDKGPAT